LSGSLCLSIKHQQTQTNKTMRVSNQDLLLGAGAIMALVGVGWLLSRKKSASTYATTQTNPGQPFKTSLSTPNPSRATSSGSSSSQGSSSSGSGISLNKLNLGTTLRTTGPYAEIGYRTAPSQPNSGIIKLGAPAVWAKGQAVQVGNNIFEAVSYKGQTIYILQSLLEAVPSNASFAHSSTSSAFTKDEEHTSNQVAPSSPTAAPKAATFSPTDQYVISRVSPGFEVAVRSGLSNSPLGKVGSNVLVGLLRRTTNLNGNSYYLADVKDALLDVKIAAANAGIVTGEELSKLVAAGTVNSVVEMQPFGQTIQSKSIPTYFSFLSGLDSQAIQGSSAKSSITQSLFGSTPQPGSRSYLTSPTPLMAFYGRA
jgi:hypothetical protein